MAPPIAGSLKLGLPQYFAYSAVGVALWSGLAVGMGAIFHVQVNNALEWVEKMGGWAALAIGIVAGLYVAFKLFQRRFFIRRIVRKMSIQLPPAIDFYVKAENAGDAEGVAQFFAPDAVVHDEGRVHKGLAAIKSWKVETRKKYNHRLEPLEIATRDGKTVLRASVSGNFPGSPIVLSFTFVLEGGRIASLKIG